MNKAPKSIGKHEERFEFDEADKALRAKAHAADVERLKAMLAAIPKGRLFDCVECGGAVRKVTGPGRHYDLDGRVRVDLPDDFATKDCDGCGERYMSLDDVRAIEALAKTGAPS